MEGFSRKVVILLVLISISLFIYLKPFSSFTERNNDGQITIAAQYDEYGNITDTRNEVEDYVGGSSASASPASASPASASPASASHVSGSPASGSPASGSPASGSPASGSPNSSPSVAEEAEFHHPDSVSNVSTNPEDHVVDTDMYLDFVHGQCNKYNKTHSETTRPRLLMLPQNYEQHSILYASNPKSGSTSFKKWFLRIQGSQQPYLEMSGVHVMKRYMSFGKLEQLHEETPREELIKPYFKVGFVRNPLTRLISGFRDKVLRRPGSSSNKKIYKHDPSLTVESSDIDKYKVFLDLIINGEVDTEHIANMHFSLQWHKMLICEWPYDLLGQTETTTQQIKIVQAHTATEEFEFPGSRAEQGQDSIATVQLAHKYYDGISSEVMDKLYEYYKWDFLLMGYAKLDNPNFPYIDLHQDFSYFSKMESQFL